MMDIDMPYIDPTDGLKDILFIQKNLLREPDDSWLLILE